MRPMYRIAVAAAALALSSATHAATITVPDDFATVQGALDAALAGDTVRVRQQVAPYHEKIAFPRSGDAVNGLIASPAFPGDRPVLDGTGVAGDNMVLIDSRSYVKLVGFEIRNNLGVHDGSGVRILGIGSHIEIRDNRIHDIRGNDAMGITVYGTEPDADRESDHRRQRDLRLRAVSQRGADAERQRHRLPGDQQPRARRQQHRHRLHRRRDRHPARPDQGRAQRRLRGNLVQRANEQGGGFAGGIYVDGGATSSSSATSSPAPTSASRSAPRTPASSPSIIVCATTSCTATIKACIVFGGFAASVGRVKNS